MTWLMLLALWGCTNDADGDGADAPTDPSAGPSVPSTYDTALSTPTDAGAPVDVPARTSDLFGDARYPALRVVLHYREGAAPRAGALEKVQQALDDLQASGHVQKPGGIRFELGQALPAGTGGDYTFETLDADLESVRGSFVVGPSAVIHGLYSDGRYDNGGEGTVLGFAYGGARLVMLRDRIDDACDDPVLGLLGADDEACDALEGTVLLHELGHLFGLVDNGLPMVDDHRDPDNGAHDIDDGCLMYWAAETPAIADTFADAFLGGDGRIPGFDASCLADMAAAHE